MNMFLFLVKRATPPAYFLVISYDGQSACGLLRRSFPNAQTDYKRVEGFAPRVLGEEPCRVVASLAVNNDTRIDVPLAFAEACLDAPAMVRSDLLVPFALPVG